MKRKILLIDDQETQRRVLRELLELSGHDVIGEGANGEEAINLSKSLKPDLIIMDVKMPQLDGIGAAKIINKTFPVPIILNTVKQDEDTIIRAKEAGVMAYLVKPVRKEELNPTIEIALSRFHEFEALRKGIFDLQKTIDARKVIDKAKGIIMETEAISERDAYRRIQKLSMNQRKTMKEIAEAIIMTDEIKRTGTG
jgi:AmiR/NasT family two-component response regulator